MLMEVVFDYVVVVLSVASQVWMFSQSNLCCNILRRKGLACVFWITVKSWQSLEIQCGILCASFLSASASAAIKGQERHFIFQGSGRYGKMATRSPQNYLTKTKIGHLKILSPLLGFLAMAFTSAGIDHHTTGIRAKVMKDVQNDPDLSFFEVFQLWMVQLGATFIVLAWIFSILVVVSPFIPQIFLHPIYSKVDVFGHIGFGVTLVLGVLLTIIYVLNVYHANCGPNGWHQSMVNKNEELKKQGVPDNQLYPIPHCDRAVFLTAVVRDIETREARSGGWKCTLFLLAALFASGHAVLCFLIFHKLRQAMKLVQQIMAGGTQDAEDVVNEEEEEGGRHQSMSSASSSVGQRHSNARKSVVQERLANQSPKERNKSIVMLQQEVLSTSTRKKRATSKGTSRSGKHKSSTRRKTKKSTKNLTV